MKDIRGREIVNAVSWLSNDSRVATVDAKTGKITAVGEGITSIRGTFVDCYGNVHSDISYNVQVGKGETLSKYWELVGSPPNVWREVKKDGGAVYPENFVYDRNTPFEGSGYLPAIKGEDGNFYVEIAEHNNQKIFTKISDYGYPRDDLEIKAGEDGKLGTADDDIAMLCIYPLLPQSN